MYADDFGPVYLEVKISYCGSVVVVMEGLLVTATYLAGGATVLISGDCVDISGMTGIFGTSPLSLAFFAADMLSLTDAPLPTYTFFVFRILYLKNKIEIIKTGILYKDH